MSDMANHPAAAKKAVLYRMVMPHHTCPYGLKARDLLRRSGYEVEDHHLTSREETEAFKAKHHVPTTPQVFIGGERVGGYDDLRRFLGKRVADPNATTYEPIVVLFTMTALMAMAASYAVTGSIFTGRAAEWFIAMSMVVLALLKLQNVETFATMFLNYEQLHLPLRGRTRRRAHDRRNADVAVGAGCALHRHDRGGLRLQGGLYRQARAEVRVRRRIEQCPARLRLAHGEFDDDGDGRLDGLRSPLRKAVAHQRPVDSASEATTAGS